MATGKNFSDRRRCRSELLCDCGAVRWVLTYSILIGETRSCGCWHKDERRLAKTTHGGHASAEYMCWSAMKQRCHNPRSIGFQHYGGRGVAVCHEWRGSFEAFLAHIGPMPRPRMTVDRIDNARGYEPGNVRWATRKEQSANRTTTLLSAEKAVAIRTAHANGASRRELADEYGVSKDCIEGVVTGRKWRTDETGVAQ